MPNSDNTLKTLGFIYQTYVALINCFEMDEGEQVVIEHLGDVTTISAKKLAKQIEVKHHEGNSTLSDRGVDIWNTVWNWYDNYEDHKQVEERVLFTTSALSKRSIFHKWNSLDRDEKYEAFKKIGNQIKPKESTFRLLYSKIFDGNHCEERLKVILSSLSILSKQETVRNIIQIKCKSYLKFLGNNEKRESFVASIFGELMTLPVRNNRWEIDFKAFDEIFKIYSERFIHKSGEPLQTE
ncbi:hypothetical protein, partial [Saccharibacillus sacchari]